MNCRVTEVTKVSKNCPQFTQEYKKSVANENKLLYRGLVLFTKLSKIFQVKKLTFVIIPIHLMYTQATQVQDAFNTQVCSVFC